MTRRSNRPPLTNTPNPTEEALIKRLAAQGLIVPTPDPAYKLSKAESQCGTGRSGAFDKRTGFPAMFPSYCGSRRCTKTCPSYRLDDRLARARRSVQDFVGNSPNTNKNGTGRKTDKLWVSVVPTGSAKELTEMCERVATRAKRFNTRFGEAVESVRVPCDFVTVFVATHDLAHRSITGTGKQMGRGMLPPTFGEWIDCDEAFDYLKLVLSSRSIRPKRAVKWSPGWKPDPLPSRYTEPLRGSKVRVTLAHRYLVSIGYRHNPDDPWCADPASVWQDALTHVDAVLDARECPDCKEPMLQLDDGWWDQGRFICRICDLAAELNPILNVGRTEGEIEHHLRNRRITFKRNGPRLRAALRVAGATQLPCGIWVLESEAVHEVVADAQ